jgi:hypothetical protein
MVMPKTFNGMTMQVDDIQRQYGIAIQFEDWTA